MENSSDRSRIVTTVAFEMKSSIARLAGQRALHDTRESWLRRGARAAGISYRQAKSLFYGESADPRSSTVEAVRGALAKRRHKEAAAREEFRAAIKLIEDFERGLAAFDPDLAREVADQALGGLREARCVDRAMGGD